VPPKILVSAGEASGDLYAAALVNRLKAALPGAEFFGCAGPRMRAVGVRPVVDAASLSVVGLFEVLGHIPRIYLEYRKMLAAAQRERPAVAILTDSPDFHLRLAVRYKEQGIPVVYLVAPQVWAWRRGRIRSIKRNIDRLLCIFPFEEDFFRSRGVQAQYIGHPLAELIRPSLSREEFFEQFGLEEGRPVVSLLPGSRKGEAMRHLPLLFEAARLIRKQCQAQFLVALPAGFWAEQVKDFEKLAVTQVTVIVGRTWDVLAWSDLALAASGTVTVEAALLGTPMVTFYRVSRLTWMLGRPLVQVPFYSMVNLVAGRTVVPELIQNDCNAGNLARHALRLLEDGEARRRMKQDLNTVAERLQGRSNPMELAAAVVQKLLKAEDLIDAEQNR